MSSDQNAIIQLAVSIEQAGTRLDRFIAGAVEDLSRQRVKNLIKAGVVQIDGHACTSVNYKLREGQIVSLDLPPPQPAGISAESIPLNIVYEDRDVIVVDKPAGLVTHPAPGHTRGTLVNALLAHAGADLSGIGGVTRPGIVHRLDKDTSGLIVVAKNDRAHKGLAAQFAAHGTDGRMQRVYIALTWGRFDRPRGMIDAPLGRSTTNRRKIAIVPAEKGRRATTHYRVEKEFSFPDGAIVSLLRLQLETGRTHQIRVHMTSVGHPLLGDTLYGAGFKSSSANLPQQAEEALKTLNRQALHAAVLEFEHPCSKEALRFESHLPDDIVNLLGALEIGHPHQKKTTSLDEP